MATGPPPVYTGPGQVQPAVHPPTVVEPAVRSPNVGTARLSGKWKGMHHTGVMQVVLGCISVLLGIVAIILKAGFFFIGFRLWSAILFYIVAGILGLAAGRKQQKGLVVGYLTMSILSSIVAFAMAATSIGECFHDAFFCPDFRYYHDYYYYDNVPCSTSPGARISIDALTIVLGIVEGIVAIVGASFTCTTLCCRGTSAQPRPVYYQTHPQMCHPGQPQGTVQVMYMPQQQMMQQPQYAGAVQYPQQHVIATAPMQNHYMAQMPPQGQVMVHPQAQPLSQPQYQPQAQPQAQPLAQPQAQALAQPQAQAPPDAPPISKSPLDHDSNPLIP